MKWLHLSDLHIVMNANWTVFERDLYKLCKDKGSIDLVIDTGISMRISGNGSFSYMEK